MSLHCGVDIVEIDRIEKLLTKMGDTFTRKVFTLNEIEYCEGRKSAKAQSYAARFAAKEAVSKALGTGISSGIGLKDIEVLRDKSGKPTVVLHGRAKETFGKIKGKELSISLSHCRSYAVAYCIILSE